MPRRPSLRGVCRTHDNLGIPHLRASYLYFALSGWRHSMIGSRSRGNAWICLASGALRRLLSPALVLVALGAATAHAEVKNVRISLDWIIQGTHAPFFV